MKRHIRTLAILCSVVLLAGSLAACGGSGDAGGEAPASGGGAGTAPATAAGENVVELTLVDSFLDNISEPDIIAMNIAIDNFTKKHPEIKITRDQSSADVIDTKIPTLAAANELPNLFACRSAWVPNFVTAGQLMSIEDLLDDDASFMEGFIPGMMDDFNYKGAHYGIPWRSITMFLMYYNTDLLKKAGIDTIPKTLEELLEDVNKLNTAGITPIALGDKGKWESRMWMSGLATRIAGSDWAERLKSGEMKFTGPEMQKALGILERFAKAKAFNPDFTSIDYQQSRQLFYDEKTAMYCEMVAFAQIEDSKWPEKMRGPQIAMDFFPQMEGEDLSKGVSAPVSADWGVGFNSNLTGEKLKAAGLFAVEVMGDDFNRILAENAGIPVRPVTDADYSKIPEAVLRYNKEIGPRLIPGNNVDARMPGAVLDVASASLEDLLLGQTSVDQALQNMQEALKQSGLGQ